MHHLSSFFYIYIMCCNGGKSKHTQRVFHIVPRRENCLACVELVLQNGADQRFDDETTAVEQAIQKL